MTMKGITLTALLLIWSASPLAADPYVLKVDGLSCPFCAYGIEKRLSRLEGVESVSTDIESGTVTITMREGARLEREQAARAVAKAGFTRAVSATRRSREMRRRLPGTAATGTEAAAEPLPRQ